ncbi:hypothetical protein AB5N19_07473 [Seiridium cardinale]|uniref:F-box domain-containing protein n=1 Tax=Seiridium cardinale TaxID=138064 RepID=A0ABR2Y4M0_9PEZI
MGKATVAFRSKPISSRLQQLKTTRWKPPGPFRFFDLPPELRRHVLEMLAQVNAHRDVLSLFLTCERMYSEAASIFYQEVVLNTLLSPGKPDPFLAGPATRICARRHTRIMSIQFRIREHAHLFYARYGPALRDMVEHGALRRLELQIHSLFPSADFWGGDGDDLAQEFELVGRRKGKQTMAPRFVTEPPFQSFLKFLRDANVPQLRLYVEALDHHQFWCQFHRAHASGGNCEGEWKGKAKMLKVNWKQVVQAFKGARAVGTSTQEAEELVRVT